MIHITDEENSWKISYTNPSTQKPTELRLDKRLLDNGRYFTQEDALCLLRETGQELPSLPEETELRVALFLEREQPDPVQRSLIHKVREALIEDAQRRVMLTSSRITHYPNGQVSFTPKYDLDRAQGEQESTAVTLNVASQPTSFEYLTSGPYSYLAGYLPEDTLQTMYGPMPASLISEAWKWTTGTQKVRHFWKHNQVPRSIEKIIAIYRPFMMPGWTFDLSADDWTRGNVRPRQRQERPADLKLPV